MIGKLKGKVENIFDDHLLLDICGVCYIVFSTVKLLKEISIGEDISLFIHTMQKDEMPVLYGFQDYQEKELFVLLTSVQGVGGRMGIALIGEIEHSMLVVAIQQENPKILQQVSGIGAKIAIRIINELKSNKKFFSGYVNISDDSYQLKQDAVSALVNLGFRKADVLSIVDTYMKNNKITDIELIIRDCISRLNKV
jgi:Holliday junction DNA helicase RuvA